MSDVTLYDTTAEFRELLDVMEQDPGEFTEEQKQAVQKIIETHVRKVDNVAVVLRHFDSQIDFADAEIARLQARKKRMAANFERLSSWALYCMDALGFESLDGETSTLKVRKNPPAVNITDAEAIPARFKTIKQEIVIDKNGVKAALKAGVEVPGAVLTQGRKVVVA